MAIDRSYLQQHYASLSDEALAAVDRGELVDAAQKLYDEERARRASVSRPKAAIAPKAVDSPADMEGEAGDDFDDQATPDWLEDASCACTFVDAPGTHHSPEAVNAQDLLRTAGIACYVTTAETAPVTTPARPQIEYRVLVPGALNLKALSILDKEMFNAGAEADWQAHFGQVSDEELLELRPEVICAGLADRIERLTRAWQEEIARRGLDHD